jgi:hypothetical protein
MAVATSSHIVEHAPVRVLGPSTNGGERRVLCEVEAERFMGVLLHPVPALEMYERTGLFRPGANIVILWPEDCTRWCSATVGDELEIGARRFTIRAIRDNPPCYSEVYVDDD